MKIEEFSDMFDTLLNSYASQAIFGEGASKQEVVLDEYEKSVLLTQAQDIVVNTYFYSGQNAQGQGFDDSIRRQVDFSSLIKTATLSKASDQSSVFDDRGIIYDMPKKVVNGNPVDDSTDVLYILNEKLIVANQLTPPVYYTEAECITYNAALTGALTSGTALTEEQAAAYNTAMSPATPKAKNDTLTAKEAAAYNATLPGAISTSDIKTPATYAKSKDYVVIPLNYKEYDREMSKAYAQPFKKQAWRLFQNSSTGFDVQSELIPLWNISEDMGDGKVVATYRVRYVKRPDPIVIVNLPDGLSIDGFTTQTECSLNPIVHMDILNKAVEIALTTRGKIAPKRENVE